MNAQSNKSLRPKTKRQQPVGIRTKRSGQAPAGAFIDSGMPALIGGFAAAAAGGLSIVPAAGIAAVVGLGYTLLRIRNHQG